MLLSFHALPLLAMSFYFVFFTSGLVFPYTFLFKVHTFVFVCCCGCVPYRYYFCIYRILFASVFVLSFSSYFYFSVGEVCFEFAFPVAFHFS